MTTAHPREDLYRFVNQLNVRYNEDQSPAGRIYRRLEVHFYTGGILALRSLLREFDEKAKDASSSWVKKPGTDADTLPRTATPSLAANLAERDRLQTIFNKVLDTSQPAMQSGSLSRTQSGPAAMGGQAVPDRDRAPALKKSRTTTPHAHPRSRSKRRAETELSDAAKKTKPDHDPIRDLTASSSLHRRQPVGAGTSASVFNGMDLAPQTASVSSAANFRSFATTTTNVSALSAIFSDTDPVGTQDTIVASTQEPSRPSSTKAPRPRSPDSYGVSSSLEASLEASLHRRLDRPQRPRKRTETIDVESIPEVDSPKNSGQDLRLSKSIAESVVSSMPSDVEREALRHVADLEAPGFLQIWPSFPSWLRAAPFPVAWEVVRIGQSCGVDLTSVSNLTYSPDWQEQSKLRKALQLHDSFQGKAFPEKSSDVAWEAGRKAAGLSHRSAVPWDQEVVYSASLDLSGDRTTPLQLKMASLKVEQSHRLARRFGADRYLELLIPSPDSSNLPASLKDDDLFFEKLVNWLTKPHAFCGRSWAAFYTKDGGAEAGLGFATESLSSMLTWALEIDHKKNASQPYKKLFQRQALVLSRTSPVMVFEHDQIHHRREDLVSSSGKVMNDGVGKMSPAVARQIRVKLGLTITPSAVQGRLGSAKGMWILDTSMPLSSEAITIETWPSQRKWEQTWSAKDEHRRTLEIRGFASLPKSARFNLQFLPVIEDRAKDKASMRMAIGTLLQTNLSKELDGQKRALQSDLQFRQWVHENATHKHDRIVHGKVPFHGGMPSEDEEMINMMLDAGFDPKNNKTLNKMIYEVQKRKCEMLMKKDEHHSWPFVVPGTYLDCCDSSSPRKHRLTNAKQYMVVDFLGVLEENEVHIGFSTAFEADDDWSKTMIHGTDVLVARSPAHFISDIQRVRAVFRPELADLTDVVVFSTKGDTPLAEKLSGGDYDGDLAWVCWDTRIVDNFENAAPPKQDDLSAYMPQDKESFRSLVDKSSKNRSRAVEAMMTRAFSFNLSKSMLGLCTNYKEKVCYEHNSVSNTHARILSTVLSNLVDQPKQGNRFTPSDFAHLQRHYGLPTRFKEDKPCYKNDHWSSKQSPTHIIDYLKFVVAKPTVEKELKSFHAALNDKALGGAQDWDEDLASFYKNYEGKGRNPGTRSVTNTLLLCLKDDIKRIQALWASGFGDESFPTKVARIYPMWRAIQPCEEAAKSQTVRRLVQGGELSGWELLKASTAFWMFCNSGNVANYGSSPRFVWQMACPQLCLMKALAVQQEDMREHGAVMAPRVVLPSMYAALRPDARHVKQVMARMEGGSHFGLSDDDGDDYNDQSDVDDRASLA